MPPLADVMYGFAMSDAMLYTIIIKSILLVMKQKYTVKVFRNLNILFIY